VNRLSQRADGLPAVFHGLLRGFRVEAELAQRFEGRGAK
jgi:hypothetical protein